MKNIVTPALIGLIISLLTSQPVLAGRDSQNQLGVQVTQSENETDVDVTTVNNSDNYVNNRSDVGVETGQKQQQGIEAFNGDTVVNPNVEIDSDDFKDHAETAARVRGAAFLCDVAGVSVQTGTVGGSIGAPTYECRVYRQQEVMKELATDTSNFAKMQRFFLWTSAIANGIGAIPRSLLGF